MTSSYYLNNIINPVFMLLYERHEPNFICMDDNAPLLQGRIIMERLLETVVHQMKWLALFLDLNPIENLSAWGLFRKSVIYIYIFSI